ncbi:MAG: DUF6151 family protein, partial [Pseudomonadota bacterium]
MPDISVGCACGAVEGVIRDATPDRGTHCVCYCKDCQAFAHYLDCTDEMLNAEGGTAIYQTLPSRVDFSKGADRLACVQVTENGIYRWYADCCKSPIGNTAQSDKLPFVGLIAISIGRKATPQEQLQSIGPANVAVHVKSANGPVDTSGQKGAAFSILRAVGRMLKA